MNRATGSRTQRRNPPSRPSFRQVGVVALAAATLLVAAACGAARNGNPSAPALQRVGTISLPAGGKGISKPLPLNWKIAMQVWFASDRSTLRIELGSAAVMVFDGPHVWHQVELTTKGLVVDGKPTAGSSVTGASVRFRAVHDAVKIRGLVIGRTKA